MSEKKTFPIFASERDLFDLIEKNDVEAVRHLIHGYTGWENLHGVRMRLKDMNFISPMSAAALWGKFDVLKLMIEEGGDINMKSEDKTAKFETILASACLKKNNMKIIQYLVEKGAKVDIPGKSYFDSQFTPLGAAIRACNFAAVKYLVENGANINSIFIIGYVPYGKDGMKIMNYLYGNGYDFHKNDNGQTAYDVMKRSHLEQVNGNKEYANWTLPSWHNELGDFLNKI